MPSKLKKFTVILDPENDVSYSVYCPALAGCGRQGEDRQDALKNIKEAIVLVLEVLEEQQSSEGKASRDNDSFPHETLDLVAKEIREVLKFRHEDGRPLTIGTVQVEVLAPVSA